MAEESLDLFFLFDIELIHFCTTITHILRAVNDMFSSDNNLVHLEVKRNSLLAYESIGALVNSLKKYV